LSLNCRSSVQGDTELILGYNASGRDKAEVENILDSRDNSNYNYKDFRVD